MKDYFCTKCHTVFSSKLPKCCGDVEDFSPEKHASFLVSSSNAWVEVWNKWEDHPALEEIKKEMAEDGCYSAAACLNVFIERILKE